MEDYLTSKLYLPIILGTNRKERKSVFVAEWLKREISKNTEIETRLFDVKNFALPPDDYGTVINDAFPNGKKPSSELTDWLSSRRSIITATPAP